MNETTEKLVRELAEKLGTTTEHLWEVLIRQAPISATCNVILCVFLLTAFLLLLKFSLKYKFEDDYGIKPEAALIVMGLGIFGFLTLVVIIVSFEMIISGYFNPEYWALKQILK